jgi:hypothetical protein
MRPLYDARVSDLGLDDRVVVECACGHLEHMTGAMLATAGVDLQTVCSDYRDMMAEPPFSHATLQPWQPD